jgi:ADP-ribosylglycohydrolase
MTDTYPPLADRYAGCLVGAALGDALGKLTEFIDYDSILHQFGPRGMTDPPANALYTDDTQLTMATARALIAAGDQVLPRLMDVVCDEFLGWLNLQDHPVNRRAPGVPTMDALGRLKKGMPYASAADGGANGSITATRSVPVALRYHGDVQKIVETASEISRVTHGHPAAVSAGAASALLVDYALSGLPIAEWPRKAELDLKRYCPDAPRQTLEAIRTAARTVTWDPEDAMLEQFHARPGYGGGWMAEEAVGIALYCFMHQPHDYVTTVRLGANAYGDSDTDGIADIAGAISGAYNGIQAIPQDWIQRLEDGAEIERLAAKLYDIRSGELVR